MKAYLVLEDGGIYEGQARGAFRETVCEVVFNTSMTGYVEALSDPSYKGLGLLMTYPMIGNYGVNKEDFESNTLQAEALLVHELSDKPSNFRSTGTLEDLLKEYNVPCISGLDTRSLTKRLRESGAMRGMLTDNIANMDRCMQAIASYRHSGLVESVTVTEVEAFGAENTGPSIAVLDCGTKNNILRSLLSLGCRVTKYPAHTSAKTILAAGHDGVLLSNGPGDPAACTDIIREVRALYDAKIPTMAICLGHQLMALAVGGSTEKMKYGHRGANHPVKNLALDRVYLSSQNHGYVVRAEGLPQNAQVSWVNVNDASVEGLDFTDRPIFTVQFHPEASSGPHDPAFLFKKFIRMIQSGKPE